jgi:predicted histidine transporter YuiF (NhaC family)
MARKVYIREIYFYMVCLISIVLFIVGLVTTVDNIANYVKPTTYTTKASTVSMYKSDQNNSQMSDAEINKMAEEEIAAQLNNEKIFALKNLLRGIVFLVIAIPLFAVHWTKAQSMWRASISDE